MSHLEGTASTYTTRLCSSPKKSFAGDAHTVKMAWLTNFFRRRRHRAITRQYHVVLQDGTERTFELQRTATVQDLVEVSLLSMSVPAPYHYMFSLTVTNSSQQNPRWLRLRKTLKKELKNTEPQTKLYVTVLMYPKSHFVLEHKVVRHLLYAQVCKDLNDGRIKCTSDVMAQLTGLIAQAQLGDYSERTLQSDYMSRLNVKMSPKHERMAVEQHKLRRGLQTDSCIEEFLNMAEGLNGYGSILFDLQDEQSHPVVLGCGPNGIEVLEGNIQTLSIKWETVTIINIRYRTINFHSDTTYTNGVHSFRCPTTKLCNYIGLLCVEMRNYYCNSEVAPSRSKLKRFLSTRLPSNKSRQHEALLTRKNSTLSSLSAPARYHNHSFSRVPQTVTVERHDNNPSSTFLSEGTPQPRDSICGSTIALVDNSPSEREARSKSLSPDSSAIHLMPTLEEKPMLTPPPSPPPSPLTQNRTQLPQVGDFPRKSTTLPARVNPSDIFNKMESEEDDIMITGSLGMNNTFSSSIEHNSGRYRSHSTQKEPENLDCINELIEEGLAPEETERTNRYSNHYHHQPRHTNRRRHSESRRPHYVNISIDLEPENHDTSYLHQTQQTHRHRHSTGSQSTSTVSQHQQVPRYVDNEELWRDGNRIKTNKKRSSADQWWLRYENGYKTGDSSSVYPYRSMTMQHPKKSEKSHHHRSSYSNSQGTPALFPNGGSHSQGGYYYHSQQLSEPSRYHSSSSLNRSNGCIMTMAHQLSLATLSQDSSTYIDPHIRSFVYDSSQADTETEL